MGSNSATHLLQLVDLVVASIGDVHKSWAHCWLSWQFQDQAQALINPGDNALLQACKAA